MSIFQKSEKEIFKDRKWYIFICKLVKQEGRGRGERGRAALDHNRKKKEKKKVNQWERDPNVSATTVWKKVKSKEKKIREVG